MYRRTYKKKPQEAVQEPENEKVTPQVPLMTMTVKEMAAELHISGPTAYELTEQPDFPSFRIGQRIIVSRKGLQEWIDRQCEAKAKAAAEAVPEAA